MIQRPSRLNKRLMESLDGLAQSYITSLIEERRTIEKNAYELIQTREERKYWKFYQDEFESRMEWYKRQGVR